MSKTKDDCWKDVEEATKTAKFVAWDDCHKIYVAMDQELEVWFSNYTTIAGSPKKMLDALRLWYAKSQECGLEFISAVSIDSESLKFGFTELIPQSWSEDDE